MRKVRRKQKRRVAILMVLLVLILALFFGFWNHKSITFVSSDVVEYGSDTNAMDLVESVSGGTVVNNPQLDTTVVGKCRIVYKVKGWFLTKEIRKDIVVKDTKKPVIKLYKKQVTVSKNENYHLYDNVKSVIDSGYGNLDYISSKNPDRGTYTIQSDYKEDKKGDYKATVIAKDQNGNTSKATFAITVTNEESESDEEVTIKNGIVLVNASNPLSEDYKSNDTDKAEKALKELQEAAQEEGYDLTTIKGYRSYSEQSEIEDNEGSDNFWTKAGYSEHQTGLAFDVGEQQEEFGSSEAGQWLASHCAEYGFIIRYPKDKEEQTGHTYAPWHIRYVGKKAAKKITEKNLCLEEYLDE